MLDVAYSATYTARGTECRIAYCQISGDLNIDLLAVTADFTGVRIKLHGESAVRLADVDEAHPAESTGSDGKRKKRT